MAKQYGVSVIAYNPLAGGMLTGKHSEAAIPPGTRSTKIPCIKSGIGILKTSQR